MVKMKEIVINILSVNATCDFLCTLGMMFMFLFGRGNWLAYSRFGMWVNLEDQDNRVAMLLFSVLVLNFGILRCAAVIWDIEALAAWSYILEGLLILIAVMQGLMEHLVGWAVFVMCVMCFVAVVS